MIVKHYAIMRVLFYGKGVEFHDFLTDNSNIPNLRYWDIPSGWQDDLNSPDFYQIKATEELKEELKSLYVKHLVAPDQSTRDLAHNLLKRFDRGFRNPYEDDLNLDSEQSILSRSGIISEDTPLESFLEFRENKNVREALLSGNLSRAYSAMPSESRRFKCLQDIAIVSFDPLELGGSPHNLTDFFEIEGQTFLKECDKLLADIIFSKPIQIPGTILTVHCPKYFTRLLEFHTEFSDNYHEELDPQTYFAGEVNLDSIKLYDTEEV